MVIYKVNADACVELQDELANISDFLIHFTLNIYGVTME